MAQVVCWMSLLTTLLTRAATLEVTQDTWHCPINGTAVASACRCTPATERAFPWDDVDCSWMDITSFAGGASLPLFVRRLDLSHNRIHRIGDSLFSRWNPLRELFLAHNGLTTVVEETFTGLTKLGVLDLGHNFLATLPQKLFLKQKHLHTLILSFNNISDLHPDIFNDILKLDSLTLSYNSEIGKYLARSHEALSKVLKSGLRHLALDNVQLSFLPENLFNAATDLRELSLADNPLTSVSNLYVGSLETLNMAGVSVSVLQAGSFMDVPSLRSLCMDRCTNLSTVEENAFEGLSKLETLSLEKCVQLHSFHGLAFGTASHSLRRFSLAQSGLRVLSEELTPVLGKLDADGLILHGNPWHCDCGLSWLARINFSAQETQLLRCYSPPAMHYAELALLEPDQFVCSRPVSRVHSNLLIGVAVLCGLLLLSGSVVTIDRLNRGWRPPCCRRRDVQYRPITVHIDPNCAEMTSVSVTSSSAAGATTRSIVRQ